MTLHASSRPQRKARKRWIMGYIFPRNVLPVRTGRRPTVARKTVMISDLSGDTIPDGSGATIRITFNDQRKGIRELDVTDAEAERLGGRQAKRRRRLATSASLAR